MPRLCLFLLLVVLLPGCGGGDDPAQPQPSSSFYLSVSLQEIQDLGYGVTRVNAVLERRNIEPAATKAAATHELLVDGQVAFATIEGLASGEYDILIQAYTGVPVLVRGNASHFLTESGADSLSVENPDWGALFPDAPRSVLLVGNSLTSYNGGLGTHLAPFVHAADPNLQVTSAQVAPGGYTLEDHWTNTTNNTRGAIAAGDYDLVLLQGSPSNMVNDPDSFTQFAGLFLDELSGQSRQSALWQPTSYRDFPQYASDLVDLCEDVADQHPTGMVPISQAWYKVLADRPDIPLFITDGSHPTVQGTYLDLCVIYAALYQRSPEGVSYVGSLEIPEDQRAYLQAVAWQETARYLGWTEH
jgi:hypothetical protein